MNPPPLPVKAKRVIFLCMAGGPSHLETFDNKPELAKLHGKPMPESFTKGQQIAQLQGKELKAFGPQHEFKRWGQSGQEFTHIFPHLGKIADEIAIIRSMQTEQINHDPAHTFMNTGSIIAACSQPRFIQASDRSCIVCMPYSTETYVRSASSSIN